ncbi:Mth938-like domain-containing protein [Thiohalomonas denitrificans]|uniref:Mth938-like domain-containing protein n=1 Tax=Thiohalomonas denitrificans TaxID=415747 RepID=UPI0026EB2D4C|nr:Mth938-like domain-containing protein [Thiohalomonas denitrificans]
MKFSQDLTAGGYAIHGYSDGEIIVALPASEANSENRGRKHLTHSFVITRETLVEDWPPEKLDELEADHFEQVAALEPEVVIFGTGASLRFPRPEISAVFAERGVGLEIMDSRAACRTYNILAAEGRRVAAALLIP